MSTTLALEPPTRPKPIVLALAETKRPPARPRRIEDLIDMDLHQR